MIRYLPFILLLCLVIAGALTLIMARGDLPADTDARLGAQLEDLAHWSCVTNTDTIAPSSQSS